MTGLLHGGVYVVMGCIEFILTIFSTLVLASIKITGVRTFLRFGVRPGSYLPFTFITIHGVASVVFAILGSIPNWTPNASPKACGWIYKMTSVAYIYVLVAFFSFLYLKCQVINLQGEIAKHWIDHLIKITLILFPVVFTTMFMIENQGTLYDIKGTAFDGSTGQFCYFTAKPYLVPVLIIADCVMNAMLTYMFRRPLVIIIKSSEQGPQDLDGSHARRRAELRKILEETLRTSVCGLAFNFVAVLLDQFPGFINAERDYNFSWMQYFVAMVPLSNSFIMFYAMRRAYEPVSRHNSRPDSKPKPTADPTAGLV